MAKRSREKLSISQMQALEAVATTGSFTKAAKTLGIAQPSVSNHIQAIENRFKTRFFTKSGYTALPTPALERLLPRIRAVLALLDDLEADMTRRSVLGAGELRIGYSTYQLAIPAISRFMTMYPEIRIEARAAASHDLMEHLNDGALDIAFITAREAPQGYACKTITHTHIVLVVPKIHALATQKQISWRQLEGLPLIQREASSGTRRIFEAAARLQQVTPNTILALGSWGSIASLIRAGNGFGVAMAAEISPSDPFVGIPIEDPNLKLGHYAVCQQDMMKVAAIDAFLASVTHA
ncbi:LysR family transcriptional regulator [Roseibium sp. CAU 1637]|uniref:LysR family transcriptional regulator n=1 Tax=Roseibium limicola TaxID=2816037 RepID=A0A939ELS3_9HYPH|nr:LysR family transcriptional regulator [Roseibium limicola]MBO0344490.1 LysR family transcriptional regulator [Roseibium limicola]